MCDIVEKNSRDRGWLLLFQLYLRRTTTRNASYFAGCKYQWLIFQCAREKNVRRRRNCAALIFIAINLRLVHTTPYRSLVKSMRSFLGTYFHRVAVCPLEQRGVQNAKIERRFQLLAASIKSTLVACSRFGDRKCTTDCSEIWLWRFCNFYLSLV